MYYLNWCFFKNLWTVVWTLCPKQTVYSSEDTACAFLYIMSNLYWFILQKDNGFVLGNCSDVTKYKLPDPENIILFFELKCWLKYVTHKYLLCANSLFSRMVATFEIPKTPKLATSDKWLLCMHRFICTCIAALTTPNVSIIKLVGQVGNHWGSNFA